MQLTVSMWRNALRIESEFTRRGEHLSRLKLMDAFQIPEHSARFLYDCLRARDIIALQPDQFPTDSGTKELVLSDIHIPFQDDLAVDAALNYADQFQPDIITLLGDTIDFYKISRFVKSPKKKSVSGEIKQTRGFLSDLRKRFPNARIIFYKGNHEDRMDTYIMSNASEIYDLVQDLLEVKLGLRELNIEYQAEPFAIGKLWHLHGHEKPGGSYNPEYVCNVMWKHVHDHFVVGHFHRNQQKTFKRIDGSTFSTASVGYLAGEMDYARLNAWSQGFYCVTYGKDGRFRGELKNINAGEVY